VRPYRTEHIENKVLEEVESTNDLARVLAESGCPDQTWVSARRQSHGRGRSGRSWVSEEGNLFLSVIVRVADRSRWTWIPLATTIALRNSLIQIKPDLNEELKIKWPNDLYLGSGKAAGVLCETAGEAVIVGVGANCSLAPSVPEMATRSLGVAVDELRPLFLQAFRTTMDRLQKEGTDFLVSAYHASSYFRAGDSVSWGKDEDPSSGVGIVIGLGAYAELKVSVPSPSSHAGSSSPIKSLFSEDVQRVRLRS